MSDKPSLTNYEPTPKDIVQDERNGEYLRIIYLDDQIAVLRSEQTHRQTERNVHRIDSREQFDKQVDAGRISPAKDADPDIPEGKQATAGVEEEDPTVDRRRQPATTDGGASSSRDSSDNAEIETFVGADEKDAAASADENVSTKQSETDVTDTDSENKNNDRVDWTAVPYVGEEISDELYNRGFESTSDIENASRDELDEIPGLGEGIIDSIRKFADG